MKKKILLTLLSGFAALLTLTSSSTGPAHTDNLNRSAIGCLGSGCHNATNSNNTYVAITLADKTTGAPVTNFKYTPGKTYRLYLLGGNMSGLTKFGFQLSCVQKAVQTAQAGVFANYPSTVWTKTISGIQVVEHGTVLSANAQGVDSVMVEWTAPAASVGTARFFYALNAVNGDGTTGGDAWNNTFTDFDPVSTGVDGALNTTVAAFYPNPAGDVLHFLPSLSGTYRVQITDVAGRTVLNQDDLNAATGAGFSIPVSSLAPGVYVVMAFCGDKSQEVRFQKK